MSPMPRRYRSTPSPHKWTNAFLGDASWATRWCGRSHPHLTAGNLWVLILAQFAGRLCVCAGPLQVLRLPDTAQRYSMHIRLTGNSELSVCVRVSVDGNLSLFMCISLYLFIYTYINEENSGNKYEQMVNGRMKQSTHAQHDPCHRCCTIQMGNEQALSCAARQTTNFLNFWS